MSLQTHSSIHLSRAWNCKLYSGDWQHTSCLSWWGKWCRKDRERPTWTLGASWRKEFLSSCLFFLCGLLLSRLWNFHCTNSAPQTNTECPVGQCVTFSGLDKSSLCPSPRQEVYQPALDDVPDGCHREINYISPTLKVTFGGKMFACSPSYPLTLSF